MQLVVLMAVITDEMMLTRICRIVFQVSFFIAISVFSFIEDLGIRKKKRGPEGPAFLCHLFLLLLFLFGYPLLLPLLLPDFGGFNISEG